MKEKIKDKKDFIIKVVLIIIIIILLIHNCTLVMKKEKNKTPTGNVDIIDIMCEDDEKCNIITEDKKDFSSKEEKDNNNEPSINDNTKKNTKEESTSNSSSTTNNSKKNNNNTNSSNKTNSTNTTNNNIEQTTEDEIEEPDNELFARDKKIVWNGTSNLKIFSNPVYNFEEKIAPESSNTYQFIVKNSTSYKIKYNINFIETNPYNINMKYKLKKNNTYIVDHYVSYNELNISEQLLNTKNNDTFYLDWKWLSSDNDNNAGENNANYSLKIDIKAESVND